MIMANTLTTEWAGRRWELRPERAVVRQDTRTVIVADLHLGKSDHFRAHGIPVPGATNDDTLTRLSGLLDAVAAETLVVLGDFFHSRDGVTDTLIESLRRFRDRHAVTEMINVRGNHDRHAGDPPAELGITCLTGPVEDDGVAYCHEPDACAGTQQKLPVLAGHLHPAIVMKGRTDRMRLPCYRFADRVAVLPAFGAFTGMKAIRPERGDRIFIVGPGRVADVSLAVGA